MRLRLLLNTFRPYNFLENSKWGEWGLKCWKYIEPLPSKSSRRYSKKALWYVVHKIKISLALIFSKQITLADHELCVFQWMYYWHLSFPQSQSFKKMIEDEDQGNKGKYMSGNSSCYRIQIYRWKQIDDKLKKMIL